MDELRAMGMPAVWLDVAEEIGTQAFIRLWQRLDREGGFQPGIRGYPLKITLRRFSSYRRYQRNRYIEALTAVGHSPGEIRARLMAELGEDVGRTHISRIGKRFRIKAA